jgi:hypothetical protein
MIGMRDIETILLVIAALLCVVASQILRQPASFWSILIPIILFLVLLGRWAYWASLAFDKPTTSKQSSLMAQFWRPSTILILLAFGFTIYTRSVTRLTSLVLVSAFVLRYWESDAVADEDVKEADIDRARDEVLRADPKRKDEHWYDDVSD